MLSARVNPTCFWTDKVMVFMLCCLTCYQFTVTNCHFHVVTKDSKRFLTELYFTCPCYYQGIFCSWHFTMKM